MPIKTSTKVQHNRPDLLVWDKAEKECIIIEFSCPADVNVIKKVAEKENIYGPLIRNLQMMYPNYCFTFIPIIIGALGTVPKCLSSNLEKLGFQKDKCRKLIKKLQIQSISGTVKICKTFLKFKI